MIDTNDVFDDDYRYNRWREKDVQGVTILMIDILYEQHHTMLESEWMSTESPGLLAFNSIEAIKQCVLAGMGIGVVPQVAVASEVVRRQLIPLNWVGPVNWIGPELSFMTQVAWHKDKWLSPTLQAFLQLVREDLTSPLTGPFASIKIL